MVDVNAKDHKGRTSLYWACRNDHWDVVGELMKSEQEVDVNVQGPLGYTALIWASLKGKLDAVAMMLGDNNVDANLKNIAGSSALDVALACGMLDVAQCLEEHKKACLRRCEAKHSGRRKDEEVCPRVLKRSKIVLPLSLCE
ncbi:hypothetical protein MHU86_1430 [Fragilaria crotonensis]|nr:hypothetical protein MHU86_1430 [Fragilaria crotonensis]